MADITNAVVVAFGNAELRPLSEMVRNLKIRLDNAKVEYLTNIAGLLSGNADTDKLLDGSPDDGRTTVTKKDMADLVSVLSDIITELDVVGVDGLISKFTVQPPTLW